MKKHNKTRIKPYESRTVCLRIPVEEIKDQRSQINLPEVT